MGGEEVGMVSVKVIFQKFVFEEAQERERVVFKGVRGIEEEFL